MVVFSYVVLAVFGLALGSFVNALVWRVKQQSKVQGKKSKVKTDNKFSAKDLSIWRGRSLCPNCGHRLAIKDLVPILSWLWLRGKCRYCKGPISTQYPLVEAATALVFTLSYAFWPSPLIGWQWVLFISWLGSSVGLMALLVYDAHWMVLPNKIVYPALAIAAAGRLAYIIGYEPDKPHFLLWWLLAVVVASGIFLLIYIIGERAGRELIGFGDVRLGLITGTLLADPALSFLMIFFASVLGTLAVIPQLARGARQLTSRIPYGPFLITATGICVLFGQSILNWYQNLFLS